MAGMGMQFGVCLPIFAAPGPALFRTPSLAHVDAAAMMAYGRQAEALGYDSLWVADHLMLGRDEAILEGWTVISALAGATSRVKLGMIHQANYFRNPALAAKMAATLDRISGGRLIHFMDCGHNGREYVRYGLPWNDDWAVRTEHLAEALDLMIALWTADEPVTIAGKTYSVSEAVNNPKPMQLPYPPLWFGEASEGILALCARLGQGWNTVPVSIAELRRRKGLLRAACEAVGRDVSELELSLETQVLVAEDLDEVRAALRRMLSLGDGARVLPAALDHLVPNYANDPAMRAFLDGSTDALPEVLANEWIVGTPEMVRGRLEEYRAEGISHVMCWFMDAPDAAGIELFGRVVGL